VSFFPAHVGRRSFAYAALIASVCLAASVIALGFRSTGVAMLAEASFQQSRVLPSVSAEMSASDKPQFTTRNLSLTRAD
jgi:hypothetical protein